MDKIDLQHYNQSEKYVRAIKKQYQALIEEISRLTALYDIDTEKPFAFDDYPALKKQVNDLLNSFAENTTAIIEMGKQKQWKMGTKKVMQYLPFADKNLLNYSESNRIVSDRVWRLTDQYKGELEMALDLGISKGQGANSLAREIKQYLNNPDKLFRRVRDKHGNLVLSQKAKEYHPGQGVYRSSFKNAQRLARTETNIAYHNASWQHYQKFDFVVGFEVRLSNNPKHCPFCSAMAGKYPKEFKFNGWHPNCRCTTIPILAKDMDNIQDEEIIKDLPPAMSKWLEDNEDKIKTAKSKPWFIKENKKSLEVLGKNTKQDISKYYNDIFAYFQKDVKTFENDKHHQRALKINSKINPAETLSLFEYSVDFYREINLYLRKGRIPPNEFYEKYIKVMGSTFDKLKSYKGEVYRGAELPIEVIEKYKEAMKTSEPYTENYYLSTSREKDKAFKNKNTTYIIQSKNGKMIEDISYFGNEKEVLFRENTKFRILSVEQIDGKNIIKMEEL